MPECRCRRPGAIGKAAAAAFAATIAIVPASRAQNDKAVDACRNLPSTVAIVDCLDKLTRQWDRRLNIAYQTALKGIDPSGVPALRASERAWLEYRKERCTYLSAGPGTIRQVIASDCFLSMTKARAEELEQDSQGPGPG
jgi:uncharacterized protein YecT (DUF1311 family)